MSHFVVVVTRTDEETLESQLEPFYEQGDERDYFMKKEYYLKRDKKDIDSWLGNEIEGEEKWLKEIKADLKKLVKDYSDKTEEMSLEEILEQFDNENGTKENSKERIELESCVHRKKWCESSIKRLKEIQKIDNVDKQLKAISEYNGGGIDREGLYWLNNPEAKWDWWTEGGRWNNWLITNDWKECNRCKVKDLSLDNMRIKEMMDRAKWYVKEIEVAKREHKKPFFWNYKKKPTIKQYIEDANCPVAPFAILHDGNWMEKGEMGWWGISDDKYTEDDWAKFFKDFIEKLDPETEIAIVDCHI